MANKLTPNQELSLLLASMGMPNDTNLTPQHAFEIGNQYFNVSVIPSNEQCTITEIEV